MSEEIKIVCARCGKLITVKKGPYYTIPIPAYMAFICDGVYFLCENCYREYKKLKEELDKYKEEKIKEWFEKKKPKNES